MDHEAADLPPGGSIGMTFFTFALPFPTMIYLYLWITWDDWHLIMHQLILCSFLPLPLGIYLWSINIHLPLHIWLSCPPQPPHSLIPIILSSILWWIYPPLCQLRLQCSLPKASIYLAWIQITLKLLKQAGIWFVRQQLWLSIGAMRWHHFCLFQLLWWCRGF